MNYTKLVNSTTDSLWVVKSVFGTSYLSIIPSCWNQTPIQLQVGSYCSGGEFVTWYCFDGTTWQTLKTNSGACDVYEEGMNWTFRSNISNPYLGTASSGSPYEWNYTGEFNSTVGSKQANLNATLINNYLSSCTADAGGYCQVPITAHSDTAGILQISNINVNDFSYLQVVNSTGQAVSTFTANFTNGTYTKIYFTSTGLVTASLEDLPSGATNLTITQDGYRKNNTITYTIDKTPANPTYFNTTATMTAASVLINTYDEKTLSAINFSVTFANSTTSKTWYNQTSFAQKYDNLTLGDTTITISSTGYETRNYYMTITPQTYTTLSAYLLATASGQYVRWHVVTNTETAISNVLVTGQINIGGSYVTTVQGVTDTSGTATIFQDPTITYQMIFSSSNYNTITSSIQPSSTDYKVYMSSSVNINYTSIYDDITIEFSPLGYIPNNPANQTFSFKITSSKSSLQYFGINLSFNETLLGASEISSSPSGGTVYVYSPLNQNGTYTVNGYFKKNGYDLAVFAKNYINAVITNSNTSIISVLSLMNSTNVNDNGGMSSKSQGLLAIFITAVVAGSVSLYSKIGGSILGLMVLAFFTFVLNWFPAGVFFITVLGVIAVLWMMRN